jgi:hypothetical protein
MVRAHTENFQNDSSNNSLHVLATLAASCYSSSVFSIGEVFEEANINNYLCSMYTLEVVFQKKI